MKDQLNRIRKWISLVCKRGGNLLVDWQIRQLVEEYDLISPFNEEQLQPNSYDVKLDNIKILNPDSNVEIVDMYESYDNIWKSVNVADKYVIAPNECILASTKEYFKFPRDVAARVEGKSSLGRWFICNHVTAGFIDCGFEGTITLEIKNYFTKPIALYPGMPIGQIAFYKTEPCENPYNGKYCKQVEPTESRYFLNKKDTI